MVVRFPARRSRRIGFSLLELILALSLAALVLVAVGMAIDLHFRMFDVRRTNVEESHVVRAVIRNIADDLRTSVQYFPPDLSGLETVTGNTATALATSASNAAADAGGALGGGNVGGGNTGVGSTGGGSSGSSTGNSSQSGGQSPMGFGQAGAGQSASGSSPAGGVAGFGNVGTGIGTGAAPSAAGTTGAEEEAAELGTPISVVGLYGSSTQLQFDISRLPRVDEYQAIYSSSSSMGAVDIPSDMKTVTYFVCSEDSFDGAKSPGLLTGSAQPSASGRGRGLMRRELSHAVSAWAESNGNLSDTYADAKLLAEEVVGLQFQYYDGEGWLADWNSDDLGGLPIAVEVTLTVQPTYAMSEKELAESSANDVPPERVYSVIIHLPAAQPGQAAPETAVQDTAAGDALVEE